MTKRRSWLEAFWRAVRGLFTGNPARDRDWLDPKMPRTITQWRNRA